MMALALALADADDLALALRGESESSGGVFRLSMAFPADVSRYAPTESAVFDVHGVLSRGTPATQRSVSSVDEGIGREAEIACLNLPHKTQGHAAAMLAFVRRVRRKFDM